jgi:hypothetical protein
MCLDITIQKMMKKLFSIISKASRKKSISCVPKDGVMFNFLRAVSSIVVQSAPVGFVPV